MIRAATLVLHILSPLQAEHRSRLRGRRRFAAHLSKYAANLVHLLGVRSRKPTTLYEQTVLEADTDIAAQQGRLRQEWHLVASGGEYRPLEVRRTKQAVGRALHEH